jgi:hypothetical protein
MWSFGTFLPGPYMNSNKILAAEIELGAGREEGGAEDVGCGPAWLAFPSSRDFSRASTA